MTRDSLAVVAELSNFIHRKGRSVDSDTNEPASLMKTLPINTVKTRRAMMGTRVGIPGPIPKG
jgi:hypothetical protein